MAGGQRALVRTVRGYEAATNDVALFERRDRERRGEERRGEERRGEGMEVSCCGWTDRLSSSPA